MSESFEIADGVEFETVYSQFHPLIQGILKNLAANESEEPVLNEAGLRELEDGIEALKNDPIAFFKAIDALIEVAYRWDTFALTEEDGERENPAAEPEYRELAHQVLGVLDNEGYVAIYKASGEVAKKRFQEFADKDSVLAPKLGEAKPKGSIDLNGLSFPKRL